MRKHEKWLTPFRCVIAVLLWLSSLPTSAQNAENTGNIRAVAWSPNNAMIAIGGAIAGELGIWIFNPDGSIVTRLEVSGGASSLDWSPDGTKLAALITGSPDTIHIWDVQNNTLLLKLPQEGATSTFDIQWSLDGNYLATSRGNIEVWNIEEGILEALFDHPGRPSVIAFAWHPNGEFLFTVTEQNILRVWDIKTALIQQEFQLPQGTVSQPVSIVSMDISPDGVQLALGDSQGNVQVIDTASGTVLNTLPAYTANDAGRAIWSVDWQANGNLIAASGNRGPVTIWDATTAQMLGSIERSIHGFIEDVEFSPYGGRLAIVNSHSPFAPELPANVENTSSAGQFLANGAVQIVVPAPSLERLQAVSEACNAPAAVKEILPISDVASQLSTFVNQLDALPENTIPAGCKADLLAVAEALQGR